MGAPGSRWVLPLELGSRLANDDEQSTGLKLRDEAL
jgi:hypothetical protein